MADIEVRTEEIKTGQWNIYKNCPWCGGQPEIVSSSGGVNGYTTYVRCSHCHAYNPAGKIFTSWKEENLTETYNKAAAAWEQRR